MPTNWQTKPLNFRVMISERASAGQDRRPGRQRVTEKGRGVRSRRINFDAHIWEGADTRTESESGLGIRPPCASS
jgi:hypothetical protein